MYVWVDALTNYLTGLGYPDDTESLRQVLAGRCAYDRQGHRPLPRRLLAGLPDVARGCRCRKQVFGHGFLLNRGEKMSKSVGNVVDPMRAGRALRRRCAALFPAARSHLRPGRQLSAPKRSSPASMPISPTASATSPSARLSFIAKNCDGELPARAGQTRPTTRCSTRSRRPSRDELPRRISSELAFSQGIEAWLRAVFACNQYIDAQAPWALRKTDPERMDAVLATLYPAIRDLAIAIQPVDPGIGATSCSTRWASPADERDFARSATRLVSPARGIGLPLAHADAASSRGSSCRRRTPDARR